MQTWVRQRERIGPHLADVIMALYVMSLCHFASFMANSLPGDLESNTEHSSASGTCVQLALGIVNIPQSITEEPRV